MKICLSLLTLLCPLVVIGWWDEGHMMIAAIARQQLTESEITVLERVLRLWEDDYPGMSDIVSASVWADHIKCIPGGSGPCELRDGIEIFNNAHGAPYPYNPLKLKLPQHAYDRVHFGDCFLETMLRSLTSNFKLPISPHCTPSSNRHLIPSKNPEPSQNTGGSKLGWSLQLRLLIHVYGDLHQPLHCATGFFTELPDGDDCGHRVRLAGQPGLTNFHFLWDSVGGSMVDTWPSLNGTEVHVRAHTLIAEFPASSFGSRLDIVNASEVARDSHKVAANVVYSEFFPQGGEPKRIYVKDKKVVYEPSAEYVDRVKKVARQQLALGGYRLGAVLRSIVTPARNFLDSPRGKLRRGAGETILWPSAVNYVAFSSGGVCCLVLVWLCGKQLLLLSKPPVGNPLLEGF